MRVIASIVLLLVGALVFGQGFNKRYDDLGLGLQQTAFGIERTSGGWVVISGSDDQDSIAPDLWFYHASTVLRSIDEEGNTIWEKRAYRAHHGVLPGWSNCCDTIPGGGYVVGGASEDTTGFDDVYLMRFDANGDTLWTKVFGDPLGNNFWIGQQVKRTEDGGFVIVGFTGANDLSNYGGFAIRTDHQGQELWRRTYSWGGEPYNGLACCITAAGDDLIMGGSRYLTSTNGDPWVQRTDSLGLVKWRISWGGPFSDGGAAISECSDGNVLVVGGRSYAAGYTAMRPTIAKLDSSDGSIIWEHEYGPIAYSTTFFAAKECPNGDLIAAGVTYADMPPGTWQKGLLCRTTSEGDSLWMFAYYSQHDSLADGTGRFYDVLPTPDGGFIAAGAAYYSATGNNPQGINQDSWVVKVDANGCIIPGCNNVGITEQATNLLDALSIFPNPVASGQSVTVQLSLPPSVSGPLQCTIVSADGRLVYAVKLNGYAGQLTTDNLSPGLYHLHITQGGKWLTGGKLVVE